MTRVVLAASLFALLAGCASQGMPAPPETGPSTSVSLQAPQQVGTFKLDATHHYPDARAGSLYRYRNDSDLSPDVYIYPVNEPAERGGPLNPAREEGMSFGRVLTIQQRQQRIESFEIVHHGPLVKTVGADTLDGWQVHAILMMRGSKHDSHLQIFRVGDRMLKVRATFPQGKVANEDLAAFVDSLLEGAIKRRASNVEPTRQH